MGKRRTDEELAVIAAKYDKLKDFFTNDYTVYRTIRKRGLFDKLCGHMKREARPDLSDEDLGDIASQYNDLKEFRTKDYNIQVSQVPNLPVLIDKVQRND